MSQYHYLHELAHFLRINLISTGHELTQHLGVRPFPQKVLLQKGMLSSETTKGKMAFRVFPPWTTSRGEVKFQVFSDSAKKTQSGQADYFLEVLDNQIQDQAKLSRLFI